MLPSPKKSILNLKNKMSKPKFFVSDYDKDCLKSIIHFYNQTEEGMLLTYNDYYVLVQLIVRYEVINNNLINQIHEYNDEEREELSIKDIMNKLTKIFSTHNIKEKEMQLIMSGSMQKHSNYDTNNKEVDISNLTKEQVKELCLTIPESMFLNNKETDKLLKIVRDFTSFLVMKKSSMNKNLTND